MLESGCRGHQLRVSPAHRHKLSGPQHPRWADESTRTRERARGSGTLQAGIPSDRSAWRTASICGSDRSARRTAKRAAVIGAEAASPPCIGGGVSWHTLDASGTDCDACKRARRPMSSLKGVQRRRAPPTALRSAAALRGVGLTAPRQRGVPGGTVALCCAFSSRIDGVLGAPVRVRRPVLEVLCTLQQLVHSRGR